MSVAVSVSVSHITQVQQFQHPITLSLYLGSQLCLGLGTLPRQISGPIVAQEVERHRETPKFCVRVIFDIYLILLCMIFHTAIKKKKLSTRFPFKGTNFNVFSTTMIIALREPRSTPSCRSTTSVVHRQKRCSVRCTPLTHLKQVYCRCI